MRATDAGPGVLLVTGASRGIGAATAWLAAQRGYAVCINYLREQHAADALAQRILDSGGRAVALRADIADEALVVHLFDECTAQLGPLAGLVNNAGVLAPQAALVAMDAARLQRVFAVNVFGTLLCAREAVRRMSTDSGGTGGAIVNVSSAASRLGSPGEYVDYAASKRCDRHIHDGSGEGSGWSGHPRECRAPRIHPHHYPCKRRRA